MLAVQVLAPGGDVRAGFAAGAAAGVFAVEASAGVSGPRRLPLFDEVLRDAYLPSLQAVFESTAWMTAERPPPMQGPREPDPETLFESGRVWVQRRCTGALIVSVYDPEWGWCPLDDEDVAGLAGVLGS